MPLYKHCCRSIITEDHTDHCLSRQEEIARLRARAERAESALERIPVLWRDGHEMVEILCLIHDTLEARAALAAASEGE